MNMLSKTSILAATVLLFFSASALAGDYTFTGRIHQITDKKIVMSDGAELKMPAYRPGSTVSVIINNQENALATLTSVGYVDKAAITVDSDNVVKKIVVMEMYQ